VRTSPRTERAVRPPTIDQIPRPRGADDVHRQEPRPDDDELTFAAWYAASWDSARRLATRLVGDATDGEDLAASVLADVWLRWRTAGRPDTPDAYLQRAIRNRSTTVFRQRDRDRSTAAAPLDPGSATAPDPEDTVVVRDEVAHLLARLPDDDRRVLELRYLADLTGAETARRLGLRPASVRSRVHRTRRRLAAA
jgi:RNA polymerase sigma-70 factor, ECF subfamily